MRFFRLAGSVCQIALLTVFFIGSAVAQVSSPAVTEAEGQGKPAEMETAGAEETIPMEGAQEVGSAAPAENITTEDFETGSTQHLELVGAANIVQSGRGYVLALSETGTAYWSIGHTVFELELSLRLGAITEILFVPSEESSRHPVYILRLFPDECMIAKRTGSQETTLGFVGRGLGRDNWTRLRVEVHGQILGIEVAADGQPLLAAEDKDVSVPPSAVGFRVVSKEGATQIDNLLLRTPPAPDPAAEPDREEVIPINIPGPEQSEAPSSEQAPEIEPCGE
jgi:hypothetical protein